MPWLRWSNRLFALVLGTRRRIRRRSVAGAGRRLPGLRRRQARRRRSDRTRDASHAQSEPHLTHLTAPESQPESTCEHLRADLPFVVACPACVVVWAWRWCCWQRCSSTAAERQQPATPPGGRSLPQPRCALVAAQRELLDRRRAGSGVTHGDRAQRRVVAQHHRASRPPSCSFISTGTRGATPTPRGCARAARRPRAWRPGRGLARRSAGGRLELHRRHRDPPARRRRRPPDRPDVERHVHRARRRQRGRSDRAVGAAAGSGRARAQSVDGGTGVDGARAAHLRAHRRRRQLLLHRAVVSRSSACSRTTAGTPTSSTPAPSSTPTTACYDVRITVPRGWVVGATGRERRATRTRRKGTTDASVRAGRRPRLRVDDQPGLSSTTATLRAPDLAAHRAAAAAAARALGAGRPAFRGDARGAEVLRRVVRPLPVRAPHRSSIRPGRASAGGMEYPTLFTAGTRWLAPGGVGEPEGVTVHEAGHQFWYGLVGNNEFEHAWLDEGLNTFSTARALHEAYAPIYYSERFFGDFVPWVFREAPLTRDRRRRAVRLPVGGGKRRAVDAVVALLHPHRRRHHVQQDRAVAAHARAPHRLAAAADAACRCSSCDRGSRIRGPTICSRRSRRAPGATCRGTSIRCTARRTRSTTR